jgi:recombinational DNA repair ATPase RecF
VTASLKTLTLSAFRGSSGTFKLNFEKGKKLTLIYGENGTGKTTICDAFEFLARDKIGSLEGRGIGHSLHQYWPSVGSQAGSVVVDLETSTNKCEGRIAGKKAQVSPEIARPTIELLRQRQILALVQAEPAERYKEIKRFIDIELFENSEASLRDLIKTLTSDKKAAVAAELENLASLQSFYEEAGSPPADNAVVWAKEKLNEPTDGFDADLASITKLRNAFNTLVAIPEKFKTASDALNAAQANADGADKAQSDALASVDSTAAERLDVFRTGQHYLHKHEEAEACPLCDSTENIVGLSKVIQSKLNQLTELTTAGANWKAAHDKLLLGKAALDQLKLDYCKATALFVDVIADQVWKPIVKLPSIEVPADPTDLPAWLSVNQAIVTEWAKIEASWRDESRSRALLKAAYERFEQNAAKAKALSDLIPNTEAALKICVEERQQFTDAIISEIADEVGKLYEMVHPTEGLNLISLMLDPKKRASLDLEVKAFGTDAPPQAYFSQSHLDTLGLCVFIALAKKEKPEAKILILDDVLGSVDEPHVERVIGMIYETSKAFQHTIVTTHYRPWREKYRWGWLKTDQSCQFIELAEWGIKDGMRLTSTLPEVERLRALLAQESIDAQSICSKAGVILEAILDYLTLKYGCSVPRKSGEAYTLGDLLPAIKGTLRDALVVEIRDKTADPNNVAVTTVKLKPMFDELSRLSQIRNAAGAHFKAIAHELPDTDAITFSKQVLDLVDTLIHPEHGWPSNDGSGSYWRNSGDSRRLHPLKRPS